MISVLKGETCQTTIQTGGCYDDFLESKRLTAPSVGIDVSPDAINPMLFPFQRDIVLWALRRGRAAIFADCGLGKGPMALEWARQIHLHTQGDVIILAPLAVAQQFEREAAKFGISVTLCKTQDDVRPGINITNYERLHHFTATAFVGVVCDEASILKSLDGKTRDAIIEMFAQTPYRLAATATPAPNDHMELGSQSEFLGVMNRSEMLAMFFTHDGGDTSKWVLKGWGESEFWKWVCTWAVLLRKPSDLGYDDSGFILPPLEMHQHTVESTNVQDGMLFAVEATTLTEQRQARKSSLEARVAKCAELVNSNDDTWVVWCDLNSESEELTKAIRGAVEVRGSHSSEYKEQTLADFANGRIRVLVSKPSIAGFGLNWQHCHNVAFVGVSHSFEAYYQAIRRCWRFGQKSPVNCHIISSTAEGAVVSNLQRKEHDAQRMIDGMISQTHDIATGNIRTFRRDEVTYKRDVARGENWTAHLGDCVEVVGEMESDSIHYCVFSPPFDSLYTYSNSARDIGNAKDYAEFTRHFEFLVKDLYRVMKPGRLLSFHCMNLPRTIESHGFIGILDFRGDLIRMFQSAGFIYHSEVCIWKDPVMAMHRTHAVGLLYKELRKDSAISRQGIPDYLVTMRKPGKNPEPITKDPDDFPVDLWRRYASPVWDDINPSDTLQRESAREEKDERHIAPLQLTVIERAIRLWSNPGDLVLTPFLGIGSEAYVAVKMGRRAVGTELKESYWRQAVANLKLIEAQTKNGDLFSMAGIDLNTTDESA